MECRAAILAGGRASRMGGSKASAELAGRPLIGYPIAAARSAGLEPFVVAKPDSDLPDFDVARVIEPGEPHHPLCGVLAALEAGGEEHAVVVVACDMPFVTGELLAWLADQPEPLVVPDAGGGPQPLLARYGPDLAGPLKLALQRQDPMQAAVASLEPRMVGAEELGRFGDPRRLCFNVNTPADLAEAEKLLGDH